jgi:pilus assembly protein FimV
LSPLRNPTKDDMDSITALEKDLTKGIDPLAENNNPATAADAILQKIENELSSIKNELGDLKKEISGLRSVEAAEPGNIEGGFFKEDEDETIALTGEELDNILTSADITEDAASIEDDLISTDEDGKIVDDIPQSDEELFQGTDLQSSLEDEVELPDSSGSHPLPGGDGFAEAQMPLEEELQVASKDPSHTIPEEIELVEEQSAAATDQGQEKIETEDLLGESPQESQPEEAFEVTDNTLPDMNDVNNLNMSEEEISSEEINFEEGDASINLDTDFESVDLDQMEGEQVLEEEESLEIPFDEELSLEEDNIDVPNIESPGQTETTDAEKQADAAAASEAFPEPTLGQGAETKTADAASGGTGSSVPESLRNEIANVLKYMDNLLDALPDEKIQEFAESEHFEVYKKLFEDLGLME